MKNSNTSRLVIIVDLIMSDLQLSTDNNQKISVIEGLTERGKLGFVKDMRSWPDFSEIMITTEKQEIIFQVLKDFYQFLSLWLEYYVLGRHEILSELIGFPHRMEVKPFADLSLATLKFAEQVYCEVSWAQQLPSAEFVWMACERANCWQRLRASNLLGTANTDPKGRLKGKTAYHDYNMRRIEDCKKILKHKDLSEVEQYPKELCQQDNQDPKYNVIGRLVGEAIKVAINKDDDDLDFCIEQYLGTLSSHLTRIKESETYQIFYLVSPDEEPRLTEKNKRLPKPLEPAPKRARGRPPKGRNVKIY